MELNNIENLTEKEILDLYEENIIENLHNNFKSDLSCTLDGTCFCVGYGWRQGDESKCQTALRGQYPSSTINCTWGTPNSSCSSTSRGYCRDVIRDTCVPG